MSLVKPSVAIILVRKLKKPRECNYEVLLAKRPENSRAFPGVHVFPGGVMEEEGDSIANWKKLVASSSSSRFSSVLSSWKDEDEFQRRAASIREVFEETNVLLSTSAKSYSHKLMSKADKEDANWFAKFCVEHEAEPAISSLQPFARWVTPVGLKARFDTVFYLAPVQDAHLEHMECNAGEIDSLDWVSPGEALEKYTAGKLRLAPPTFIKLREMRLCTDYDALMDPPSKEPLTQSILPVAIKDPSSGGAIIVFPGDKDHPSSQSEGSTSIRRMFNPGPRQTWMEYGNDLPLLSNIRITKTKL